MYVRRTDEDSVNRVASLADPTRRALYEWVSTRSEPVTRDQTAAALGVAHHVAKFNLDRLVADGFLTAEYRRPPGKGGPGAGRPAKVYARSTAELDISIPPRQYDVAGRVLACAIARARDEGVDVEGAVRMAAADEGRAMARATERSERSARRRVTHVLAANGYDPRSEHGDITLTNCPFHALAEDQRDLVCGMNLALLEGVLDEVGAPGMVAVLDPVPGRCCVRITAPPSGR